MSKYNSPRKTWKGEKNSNNILQRKILWKIHVRILRPHQLRSVYRQMNILLDKVLGPILGEFLGCIGITEANTRNFHNAIKLTPPSALLTLQVK